MGDHKKTHCLYGGHPLTPPNLCYNSLGYRECRQCKYARARARAKAKRAAQKALQQPKGKLNQ